MKKAKLPQVKGYVTSDLKLKVKEYCDQMNISESNLVSLAVTWFIAKEGK